MITITCDLMTMITSSQMCGGNIDSIHQHPHHRRHDHREAGDRDDDEDHDDDDHHDLASQVCEGGIDIIDHYPIIAIISIIRKDGQ